MQAIITYYMGRNELQEVFNDKEALMEKIKVFVENDVMFSVEFF